MTDPAPSGGERKKDLFLAPLPVADGQFHPAPEEPPPGPAGATKVEPVGMAPGVGGDEHAAVLELHEPALADHADLLAGQPHARLSWQRRS